MGVSAVSPKASFRHIVAFANPGPTHCAGTQSLPDFTYPELHSYSHFCAVHPPLPTTLQLVSAVNIVLSPTHIVAFDGKIGLIHANAVHPPVTPTQLPKSHVALTVPVAEVLKAPQLTVCGVPCGEAGKVTSTPLELIVDAGHDWAVHPPLGLHHCP